MTTAHKPTFHPAVGRSNQGGYRYTVQRQQFSSRDLKSQYDLKQRKPGQNTKEEIKQRNLLAELEEKEKAFHEKIILQKQKQGLLIEPDSSENAKRLAIEYEKELAAFDDSDDSQSSSNDDDEDSDLDSDDEEKALMAELAAIKKEKALKKAKEEAEAARKREAEEESALIEGNPLFNKNQSKSFTLKRKWTEETVFKNQGNEPKRKKRFINDTIRSDFHRKFMHRYIK